MRPGDVVTVWFPDVQGNKLRPAVVVSTAAYHQARPDVVIALLTTQIGKATATTDYVLQDWKAAGLAAPSACRAFLATVPVKEVKPIGRLTGGDWKETQKRLGLALAAVTPAQLQAEQAAAREQQRADKLAAKLKELGVDPEQI